MRTRRWIIYLNDHLALALAGVELADRVRKSNEGTDLEADLDRFGQTFGRHRASIEQILKQLGGRRDPLKLGAAWISVRFGKLKLNGSLLRYSDLSRVIELEALCLAAHDLTLMWELLEVELGRDGRVRAIGIGSLAEEARQARDRLNEHRLQAARAAT